MFQVNAKLRTGFQQVRDAVETTRLAMRHLPRSAYTPAALYKIARPLDNIANDAQIANIMAPIDNHLVEVIRRDTGTLSAESLQTERLDCSTQSSPTTDISTR